MYIKDYKKIAHYTLKKTGIKTCETLLAKHRLDQRDEYCDESRH